MLHYVQCICMLYMFVVIVDARSCLDHEVQLCMSSCKYAGHRHRHCMQKRSCFEERMVVVRMEDHYFCSSKRIWIMV